MLKETKPPEGGVAPLKSRLELGTDTPPRNTEVVPTRPVKFEFAEAGKARL
jgi:hypothetical protein